MRREPVIAVLAAVVIAAAYLAGYLPEQGRRTEAEARANDLQSRLVAAEARVRAGELLGQALTLAEVAAQRDYPQAQALSSRFFDAVRAEAAATPESRLRDGLGEVLAQRDAVTAGLATADPGVLQMLHAIEQRLRRALGYAMPPEAQ